MDILKLMKEKEEQFAQLQEQIKTINNELMMIQGEYRLLRTMGIEQNLLDSEGKTIEQK